MQTGKIFDIKKFAIHDGPGIRTTVFFKGCPLSCRWCHNPEGISKSTQRIYRRERCIGCEECIKVCPNGAVVEKEKRLHWIATDCNFCKTCAQVCPAEAVEFIGRTMSVDEIMAEIAKDTVFYNQSHGGVTISGGEPLMQTSFLLKLLDACGELDLHRAVDTCGHTDTQTLLRVASRTELFLFDLKHMDPEKHCRYTGVSNEMILTNLIGLCQRGARSIVRVPLIPGFNCDEENIERTGEFIASLAGIPQVNLLPFHRTAVTKYKSLELENKAIDIKLPSKNYLETVARRLEHYDLQVKIGG
ncbi:MAG: glycyl-radical enzyme activating protein [Deltaproteobacteria bacterium]|nr:glycyl-radical enzyme activating protein [Deltaproteobacteria bacterium]